MDQGQAHDGAETDAARPLQTLRFDGSFQLDGTPLSSCSRWLFPAPPPTPRASEPYSDGFLSGTVCVLLKDHPAGCPMPPAFPLIASESNPAAGKYSSQTPVREARCDMKKDLQQEPKRQGQTGAR